MDPVCYMGGCQNDGPFFGYPKYLVPYYNRDPKRDHHFDNHPYERLGQGVVDRGLYSGALYLGVIQGFRL